MFAAWGFLPCKLRPLRERWGVGGMGHAPEQCENTGAALKAAIAPWSYTNCTLV